MTINYYNSVTLLNFKPKEQAFSLTNMLYNLGDKLSKLSGMYKGKTYTVVLGKTWENTHQHYEFSNRKSFSCLQKTIAFAGSCLKQFSATFNKDIQTKHLLAQAMDVMDGEKFNTELINKCLTIILRNKNQSTTTQNTKGEGADVGPELMAGCCVEWYSACCKVCCTGRV